MKLNKQGRDDLRKIVERQLEGVPKGQRVYLDKELLEELLFETIIYNQENGSSVKLPYWSGPFLSKIDLSKISFENVSWTLLSDFGELIAEDFEFNSDAVEKLKGCPTSVHYSNTNANIDFTKSWETKINSNGKPGIACCDFSGMNFSNIDINIFSSILSCDLSNTGLVVSNVESLTSGSISDTKLDNLDLSSIQVSAVGFVGGKSPFDRDCSFVNTKLNVIYNPEDFRQSGGTIFTSHTPFANMIKNGQLVGCYINGKLLHSEVEKLTSAQKRKAVYEQMKNDLTTSVIEDIDQQVTGFSRK